MYPKNPIRASLTIEKSEFICYLFECHDVEEYKEYLNAVKKKHYDATHHCSAFIAPNIKRSSDDGEPAGTAGVPILNTLEKRGLDNTLAIVVRYFGGIKLGAGGLIRAYGNATSNALDQAELVEDVEINEYQLTLPYDLANKIDYFLRSQTDIEDTNYDIDVTYTYLTNLDLEAKILEYTKGISPKLIGTKTIQKLVNK